MLVKEGRGQAESAYWQEPVLWGTKLDLPSCAGELMTRRMVTARVVTLGQVVVLTGPQMDDPSGLTARLGLISLRTVQKLLENWKAKPSCHDRLLLTSSITMVLRYQKCLVARPPSQKACSSSPPGESVSRRVSTSVKRGVLSLIDTLKHKRPVTELPQ
ncbi:Amyloid-beta A4 precursor protein-binding family B member 2 [Takifugu flavidus]|uniref:Amyloid-beta A4 protein-binding family B member 2 n=1 Tax=Takifugu flavidus TaxID=433684 RepID=A0A5C6MW92_9TELE|nr:Amyloid-beta A4 precursor protein-binding family B member 2 [Takifugu flavidus]